MRLLLLSNSTQHGRGMLDHAESAILEHLEGIDTILFVPFALADHAAYTAKVSDRLGRLGIAVEGLHAADEAVGAVGAVESAQAVYVGGGNTFRLVQELRTRGLLDPLRKRVLAGLPYMGASAGTNLACPTIRTTNDMPIVDPGGFEALGLVPFQINPHYVDPPSGSSHMGETRETRLNEFLEQNDGPVLGLREGGWLRRDGDELELFGLRTARVFRKGQHPEEIAPPADLSVLLAAQGLGN